MSIRIAPSLLSANFGCLGEQVRKATAGGADFLHFDVMDGHFVPNITFGPLVVKSVRAESTIPFDVHLMIENPQNYVGAFAKAGADYIVVHAEVCTHLQRVLSQIRELGKKPGVALNPATPLSAVEWVLDDIDLLLLMSVNPGFGGQKFIPAVYKKISDARKMIEASRKPILLEVDGGVNVSTIQKASQVGADTFVAGTAVFGASDGIDSAIKNLRHLAEESYARL